MTAIELSGATAVTPRWRKTPGRRRGLMNSTLDLAYGEFPNLLHIIWSLSLRRVYLKIRWQRHKIRNCHHAVA
jgi:hypothetical protein